MASDLVVSECDPDRVAQKHVCWNEIGGEALGVLRYVPKVG